MIRQTPFSFCTPNGHTGVIFVIQYYHFNSYFEGHHFLRWGSLKYFSLSLCFLSRAGLSAHRERNYTAQHTHSQQQKRRDEELRGGSEEKPKHHGKPCGAELQSIQSHSHQSTGLTDSHQD